MHWLYWFFIQHAQVWIGIGIGGFLGLSYASLVKIAIFSDCEYFRNKANALALDVEFWKKRANADTYREMEKIPAPIPAPELLSPTDPMTTATAQTAVGQLAGGRRGLSTAFKTNVP